MGELTFHKSIKFTAVLAAAFISALSVSCSSEKPEPVEGQPAAEPAAAASTPAPAAQPSGPKSSKTDSIGSLSFGVNTGDHEGRYGGKLTEDSKMGITNAGDTKILTLVLVHKIPDGSTHVFTFNGEVDASALAAGTEIDLAGKMTTAGHLPDGVEKNPRYFTVNSIQGSGTMKIDAVDLDKKTIKATFKIVQDGIEAVGAFEYRGK